MRGNQISLLLIVLLSAMCAISRAAEDVVVTSPDGTLQFKLLLGEPRPRFSVMLKDATIIDPSPISMTIDNQEIFEKAQPGTITRYERNQTFPSRLIHSTGVDRCNGAAVPFKSAGGTDYTLEIRAYDSGVAFRTIVPGADDAHRVPDERTSFGIPDGSTVWHYNLRGHYEGEYAKTAVGGLKTGEWVAPPMTFKTPSGVYGSITEADLVNYSGMALECDGARGFAVGLGHRQPVSYPYELRYSKEDVARIQKPAVITGTITTPWRVVLVGADLNQLVNSDVIQACCPPPDPKLFPDGVNTDWCKAGRAVWRYTDGGENSIEGIRAFSKLASQLGFEYQVIEGLWHRWSPEDLKSVVDESRKEGVRLLVWEHSKNLYNDDARHAFFKRLTDAGVAGAKIDFFDNEHKDTVDLYQKLLREGAQRHLVFDFHGANKPTGESRTWPNELSREAIRGMESSSLKARAFHQATLPFTRYLAGHAEYTVVHFGTKRQDTSVANQVASAAILSSEMLTYALNPEKALASPAVDMIKSIPATWDETIVLPPSEISELALYARRSGDTWYVACMNGPGAKSVDVPLSFLPDGEYHTLMVRDGKDDAPTTQPSGVTAIVVENSTLKRSDHIKLDLTAGGGFIARFSR